MCTGPCPSIFSKRPQDDSFVCKCACFCDLNVAVTGRAEALELLRQGDPLTCVTFGAPQAGCGGVQGCHFA